MDCVVLFSVKNDDVVQCIMCILLVKPFAHTTRHELWNKLYLTGLNTGYTGKEISLLMVWGVWRRGVKHYLLHLDPRGTPKFYFSLHSAVFNRGFYYLLHLLYMTVGLFYLLHQTLFDRGQCRTLSARGF